MIVHTPPKVLYDSDFYRIEMVMEKHLLKSEWLRPVNYAEMKQGGHALHATLQQTGAERVIAIAHLLTTLDTKTKDWLATDFYQLLSETNIQKLARVLPENVFSRIALESVVTRAEAFGVTKFSVRNFLNPEEAEQWLLAD